MTAPRVLPEYAGGNMGQGIAQAFMQRDQLNRQKDLDAVNTGVGLHPISTYEAENPEPAQSGFGHMVRGAIASVRGQQNPDDAAHAQWQLGNVASQQGGFVAANPQRPGYQPFDEHPSSPQVGVTPSAQQPDGFGAAQPKTPGAFNAMTGGFGPSIARYAKLPSGQTVDMAYTPFGEKLQQAMLTNQLNQTLLGIRGNQRMDQIGAQNDGRANVADIRGGYQVQTTGMRNDQSNTNNIRTTQQSAANHDTPSGSAIYSADHRAASGAGSPIQPLVHEGTFVNKQLSDTQGQINAINKLPSLDRHSTLADSANYNSAKASVPRLRQRADSLRGVLSGIGAKMGGTKNLVAPDQGDPNPDKAQAYESLRDQGYSHEDAVNLIQQGPVQ